jgi:hypothetical protein
VDEFKKTNAVSISNAIGLPHEYVLFGFRLKKITFLKIINKLQNYYKIKF